MPTLHGIVVGSGAGSGLEHPDLGISKFPPPFCFNVLYYIIVVYFFFVNFSL